MKVGILGAMDEEIMLLLEHYKDYESICFGGNTFYQIRQNGIVIASSRIGKVFSALSASIMILHFGCEGIIFTGVAGGVNPKYKIGDLVLGVELAQHDVDITAFGHPFGFLSGGKVFTKTDEKLNSIAKEVAKNEGFRMYEGIIATGDQFIHNSERKEWIKNTFKADVIEMEGASVAVVCDNLQIPFCILRAISDNASDEALVSYEEFLEEAARKSTRLVIKMLEKMGL